MLSRDELGAWLRLATTPGIARATARQLLASFGSAERVLTADGGALLALAGPAVVELLTRRDRRDAEALEATRRWLDTAEADAPRDIVVLGDPRYPALLLETADPPLLLFTLGRVALLSAPGVAIVGSRSATPQGMDNARTFARFLSQRGLAVVSGLAMGIDGAAHEGALAGAGATVAFIGTGIDRVYPARHAALARRIAAQGLVASEYPLGAEPLAAHFPRRNRLIAGTTLGTLVVEAAVESGSLITARMAAEAGREVFAIPGSIQEGAKLVETGDDVLRELRLEPGPVAARHATAQPSPFGAMTDEVCATAPTDALLDALGYDPVTLDVLAARTGLRAEQLAARLLELELAGAVQRLPGGLLQRRAAA
jgi:DNA processing protein